jgi:ubiquinone/menaquinone biosynthesis C-methylase UbiE
VQTPERATQRVKEWWNANPFTLGLSESSRRARRPWQIEMTGQVPLEQLDLSFFLEVERKFRKHTGGAAQGESEPPLSRLIDLPRLTGKRVLDIATGTGFSTAAFAGSGARVTAIDITEWATRATQRNLAVRQLGGAVAQVDAQRLAFPDAVFDFVHAWGCLMHMPDTEGAIREMARVCRPGGRFLAYMYNKSSWTYWFNFVLLRGVLMGYLPRYRFDTVRLVSRFTDGAARGGNMLTRVYTPREAIRLFAGAAFERVRARPFYIPHEVESWPLRSLPLGKRLPSRAKRALGRRLAWGLIVEGSRPA